jgi:hypothetical protein
MTRSAPKSSRTQCSAILRRLIEARGAEVPLCEISSLATQYNSRIWSLRKMGFVILNRTEERDGVRHSWFRLLSGPPAAELTSSVESPIATTSYPNSIPSASEDTLPLFPEGDR